MAHYLLNEHSNQVAKFEAFDKEKIKSAIVEYLSANKGGMLTHEKDFSKQDAKKYVGSEVLNVYECNPKTGKPSKLIQRGWGEVRYLSLI